VVPARIDTLDDLGVPQCLRGYARNTRTRSRQLPWPHVAGPGFPGDPTAEYSGGTECTTDGFIVPTPAYFPDAERNDPLPPYFHLEDYVAARDPHFPELHLSHLFDAMAQAGQNQPPPQGNAPQQPAAPPPPDINTLLAQMATTMALLTQIAQNAPASHTVDQKDTQAKPERYAGDIGATARSFLANFALWANVQGERMNTRIPATATTPESWAADANLWIASAMSFLTGDAATWALPYQEALTKGDHPFADWSAFIATFEARFIGRTQEADARRAMAQLVQGNGSVAEYQVRFNNLAPLTRYSDVDLWERYRKGLSDEVKDVLAISDRDVSDLAKLKEGVLAVDKRMRERKDERAAKAAKAPAQGQWRPAVPAAVPASASWNVQRPIVTAPVRNPNAMDVDATFAGRRVGDSFRAEWTAGMRNRCYGCGEAGHVKSACPHAQSLCSWCGKAGHIEKVCYQKVQGKPRAARPRGAPIHTAATIEEVPAPAHSSPPPAPVAGTGEVSAITLQAQLQAMREQNEMLMAMVARLEAAKADF
jgi:hypothetical protein